MFWGYFVLKSGGEGGIRTLDTFDRIPVFESKPVGITKEYSSSSRIIFVHEPHHLETVQDQQGSLVFI